MSEERRRKYANWLVENEDLKGTADYESVADAYRQAREDVAYAYRQALAGQDVPTDEPVADSAPDDRSLGRRIIESPIVRGTGNAAMEVVSGVNRPFAGLIDLAASPVNAALQLAGSERRIPALTPQAAPPPGTYLQGEGGRVIGTASEYISSAVPVTAAIKAIPTAIRVGEMMLPQAQQFGRNIIRSFQSTPYRTEAATAGGFGVGSELADDLGIPEPVAGFAGAIASQRLNAGISSLVDIFKSSSSASSRDIAMKALAEQMVRSGLTPNQVEQELKNLGDLGMPADLSSNFLRMMKAVANQYPEVEGSLVEALRQRQAGQADRIMQSFTNATGTTSRNVYEAIDELEKTFLPQINDLYSQAHSRGVQFPPRIMEWVQGNELWRGIYNKALVEMEAQRAAGRPQGTLSLLDFMKRELDGQIGAAVRAGDRATVANRSEMKKILLSSIDIPEYTAARQLYSSMSELEAASEFGRQYLASNVNNQAIQDFLTNANQYERQMFLLGAKEGILNKIDLMQNYADVTRLFSRNGDVQRLKLILGNEYDKFAQDLAREAQFSLTRRGIEGNSTSAKQLADIANLNIEDVLPVSIKEVSNRLLQRYRENKSNEILSEIGRFLSEQGADPAVVANALREGNQRRIQELLIAAGRNELPSMDLRNLPLKYRGIPFNQITSAIEQRAVNVPYRAGIFPPVIYSQTQGNEQR